MGSKPIRGTRKKRALRIGRRAFYVVKCTRGRNDGGGRLLSGSSMFRRMPPPLVVESDSDDGYAMLVLPDHYGDETTQPSSAGRASAGQAPGVCVMAGTKTALTVDINAEHLGLINVSKDKYDIADEGKVVRIIMDYMITNPGIHDSVFKDVRCLRCE